MRGARVRCVAKTPPPVRASRTWFRFRPALASLIIPPACARLSGNFSIGYVAPMKFSEADAAPGYLIEGYEPGAIHIAGRVYRQGLIVTPAQVRGGWGPEATEDLAEDHLGELLAFSPQVVVLGTGRYQIFPDPAHLSILMRRGIGIEIMDTGAACRTYNILVAEGRHVVAGLMIIRPEPFKSY